MWVETAIHMAKYTWDLLKRNPILTPLYSGGGDPSKSSLLVIVGTGRKEGGNQGNGGGSRGGGGEGWQNNIQNSRS